MLSDRQAISLGHHGIDIFSRFYIHDFMQATLLNNKSVMSQHNLIAQFGKRSCRNLKDGFSSIIKVNTNRTNKTEHSYMRMGKKRELVEKFISHFANGSILDLFGGGGGHTRP